MRNTTNQQGGALRHGLLAGAAALAIGLSGTALAQQAGPGQAVQVQPSQAPSQQPGSSQPAVVGQLRTAEQALLQSQRELSGSGQPNYAQARTAVEAGLNVMGRVPQQMQGQDVYRSAQRELNEAQQALQGQQPNQQQVSAQMREAAEAIAALAVRMGNTADAGTTVATGQQRVMVQPAQPQVNVQQPAPQITVQQQQPQITVTQPPPQVAIQQPAPQVTVQQPEPRVTVQQAQPQVRVQQAEPQVTVRSPGQPEVSVQRPGEPQVVTRAQEGAQVNRADQRTGATAAVAPPAQSGGAQPQQAAVSPAAGVALQSVQSLVGTNVVGANGREAGEVRNLLIDSAGRVRAAVVEWGGFLGIGTREAAVPIERIQLGQGNERARLEMTREELEALPRYDRDRVAEYGRERGWGENLRLFR
jgi:sporulation protein YlmC with PRC-barrel domain